MDTVINLKGVGLEVKVNGISRGRLKDIVTKSSAQIKRRQNVRILEDINLQVNKGDILAVLGPNGSGKSTLLRLIAGIFPPTEGLVEVFGKTAPMIELGAGFHDDLSGRENILLYSSLLGRGERVARSSLNSIIAWSEIGDKIDFPVRTYSSGMLARLAFAIATEMVDEIVLVDEVLSVGDASFINKSYQRMAEIVERSSAAVIVTHNLDLASKFASKAVLLEGGKVKMHGECKEVVEYYQSQ